MKPRYVAFIGKFTDLIPDGWTFQKLFARNYRQYHKVADGSKYGQGCRIWQHYGGYLEIDVKDCSKDLSVEVIEVIQNGKIDNLKSLINDVFNPGQKIERYSLIFDMVEKKFYPFHSEEYKSVKRTDYKNFECFELGLISKAEWDKYEDYNFERYIKISLDDDLIAMIRSLLARKWIEIRVDNRK